jgi:hypothetical protein
VSRTSLYSVHNDLSTGRGGAPHVQLNPAVVLDDEADSFTLSLVSIGPRLAKRPRLLLGLPGDAESVRQSLHCRTEAVGSDRCLTVALFPATRNLLESLANHRGAVIRLESEGRGIAYRVSDDYRRNLRCFLDETDRRRAERPPVRRTARSAL